MRKTLRRILPWLVAVALFAYLLSRFSPADVAHKMRMAAGWTVPAIAGLVLLVYLADSLAIWKTFGWFVARLSFKEVLVVRGATYLLALVNYALGQGAIVYFVNRSRGVPVSRGTAAVLLVMGINVLMLLALASLGLAFVPQHDHRLGLVVAVAYAGLVVYVGLVLVKPRFLTSKPIFDVLLNASLTDYLKAMAARTPHILSLMTLTYTSMRAFHIDVPIGQAVLCLPMVYFVAVLPISPQGLGTTEFMMTTFFAKYAPGGSGAAVVASSLALRVIAMAVQSVIGFVCLRNQLARDIAPPVKAEAGCMIAPQRMRATEYRRPRKINAVSVTMLAFLGIAVYLGLALWPVMALRLRVKSEIEDVLPNLWRINLRSEEMARTEIPRMKRALLEKLPSLGVRDKHADVVFDRSKKRVAIEVRFATSVTFPVLNKTKTFQLAPRAETDAARVEW